jgi:glycosyltransferase involved in cell wall biosynthesis
LNEAPRLWVIAAGTRSTASTRHRLWHYRPFLERDGIRVRWTEYEGGRVSGRLRALRYRAVFLRELVRPPPRASVILLQKILPPARLVRRWIREGHRVVYDFDDALYARFTWGESQAKAEARKVRFDRMLQLATRVIAGSPPLGDYARTQARDVHVLYPSLDRDRFAATDAAGLEDDAFRIGWIGNDQSQVYLRDLVPVLERLFVDRPNAVLTVCSSTSPSLSEVINRRIEFLPWSEEAELEAVSRFDIAISPMGLESWSQARGGRVSVLLSMASGTPVVASPGGGLEELVDRTGAVRLVRSLEDWTRALDELAADPDARMRLGQAGRSLIDRRIWADVQYPELRRILFD